MLDVKFKNETNNTKIIINGIIDKGSRYIEHDNKRLRSGYFKDPDVINVLLSHTLKEITSVFTHIELDLKIEWWKDREGIIFFASNHRVNDVIELLDYVHVSITLQVNPIDWAKGWSIGDFFRTMNILVEKYDNLVFDRDDNLNMEEYRFLFKSNYDNYAESDLQKYLQDIKMLIEETNNTLLELKDKESIVTIFNFPEEIKTPCHQYLIYFVQFLEDLGIGAKSEIREQVHSTLFKVTPTDKNHALDRIKTALDVYISNINLSHAEVEIIGNGDIAFMQYQANVMHFKSQMILSQAVIQAKETTIQLKDAIIESLKISNYQLKNLLENNSIKEKDKEDLIPGIVSVKRYENSLVSVNAPEILRQLKRFPRGKLF